MRANWRKKSLTFAGFVIAAHDAWDERRAGGLLWLAVNTIQAEFRGRQRFDFSKRNFICLPF